MGKAARALLTSSHLWLCYSCKPCSVCFVSGRTRKLRLVRNSFIHFTPAAAAAADDDDDDDDGELLLLLLIIMMMLMIMMMVMMPS